MSRFKKLLNYNEFTIGQKWTDGYGTMEIIEIKQNFKNVIFIVLNLESPIGQGREMFMYDNFKHFLNSHEKRIRPVVPEEIETEDFKNNRFEKIDD